LRPPVEDVGFKYVERAPALILVLVFMARIVPDRTSARSSRDRFPSSGHIELVTLSSPRTLRRLSIALASALAACDSGTLQCDETPELGGTATFEGDSHTFDHGQATIYMAGTREDPCIDAVSVTAKGEAGAVQVYMSAPEGGGPLALSVINFGEPYIPEKYGLWNEDISKFSATFELEERNDDCARGSLTVTGTDGRMFLAGSEDWGPYMLTDVDLTMSGTWSIEWRDQACE
jgi:hypothetical protein